MKRRALLAAFGTATALTAGCLDRASGSGNPTDTNGGDEPSDTDTPGTTTTDGSTDSGGSKPIDPLEGVACPSFSDDADRSVCWPHDDVRSETVYVESSSAVFEPSTGDNSVETIEFTLHNASTKTFGLNPHAWSLRRQTEDGWSFVAPDAHVEPWKLIESGGTYTWRLSVEQHPSPRDENAMPIVQDLDDGVYAFQITGAFGDGPESGTRVECVALFRVQRTD